MIWFDQVHVYVFIKWLFYFYFFIFMFWRKETPKSGTRFLGRALLLELKSWRITSHPL